MSRDFHEMLPQCGGPKLHAFSKRAVDIQGVRLLSDNEQNGQSHVFEVIIDGMRYALKVFKFYDVDSATFTMSEKEIKKVPIETIRFHTDPFYNANGKVAVRCHGHMAILAAREEELARRFEVYAWDRPEDDSKLSVSKRQPFRAIVKGLIEDGRPPNEKKLIRMRKDFLRMHKLGVYPQDVQERNYGGRLLLDLSIAITKPHWVFEMKRPWWISAVKNSDMNMLQVNMLDSGVKTWQRAVSNREYCTNCEDILTAKKGNA